MLSPVAIVSPVSDPSALEALTLAEASNIPASSEVVVRTFSSVALALGWSYAHAPKMPANLLEMAKPAPTFKRPAYHAPEPLAESVDDVLNGGQDYAQAA